MELTVAFSTDNGEDLKTDDHAGMAKFFDVYRYTADEVRSITATSTRRTCARAMWPTISRATATS